jgi:fluoride ion exporter CrcB/FEX
LRNKTVTLLAGGNIHSSVRHFCNLFIRAMQDFFQLCNLIAVISRIFVIAFETQQSSVLWEFSVCQHRLSPHIP